VTEEGACQPPQPSFHAGPDDFIDAGELLSVSVQRLDDVVSVIHVAGEVDMLTGPLLQDQLREVLATRPQQLIIDLSQVSFMGSTALSVLISARHAAANRGITLQLRGTHRRAVAVPLQIAGVDHLFETDRRKS
jgi:anti-sigma B factor antagonist